MIITTTITSVLNKREFFNNLALTWDDTLSEHDRQFLQHAMEIVTSKIQPGSRVLDLGCGTGVLFPYLNNYYVTGIDISSGMIERARNKNAQNVTELIVADAHQLSFPNEYFAHVVMLSVFPHFEHPLEVLAEVHRVLEKNGSLSIIHLKTPEEVNAIHSNIGGAVSNDFLPKLDTLKLLLQQSRFNIEFAECNRGVIVVGRKSNWD
jgi:ubiquinone/menaquinone biosynthesis C-methylase UbiE